tara:strand:+ start:24366 stop:24650 length:285 start_codon:yes stop_codon:yes gene_type:complete
LRNQINELNLNQKERDLLLSLLTTYDSRYFLTKQLEEDRQIGVSKLVKDFIEEAIGALARERGELRFFTHRWLIDELEQATYRLEYYANNAEVI